MDEWISILDRMPTVSDLTVDRNGYHCILVADQEGWEIHGWIDPLVTLKELKAQRKRHGITHWRRLPTLPETEGDVGK